MISTSSIKPIDGKVFTIGSESAEERILIVGSCRSVPYINYLDRFIKMSGASMRVQFIDPNDWHWDEAGNLVDFEAALQAQESNPNVLLSISEATVYLHEHYAAYGMFNSLRESEKNIFQFGMKPRVNVCIPNFHDHFILFNDQVQFNAEHARDNAMASYGVLTEVNVSKMRDYGLRAVDKFLVVCLQSDFPEMADHFAQNWLKTRFFWTGNHVTSAFTTFIFERINERFLHLPLTEEFWGPARQEDLFAKPSTPVTQYDVDSYGFTWGCPLEPLKLLRWTR